MEFHHVPVMLRECMENLNIDPSGVYADGTLGGAGHSREICRRLDEDGMLIGIDRDRDALQAAEGRLKEFSCRKIFVQSNYSDIKDILRNRNLPPLNGALLDLGVSSFQLDEPERGFSYMHDAPLDMRMNQQDNFSAWDVVNTYSEKELKQVISKYGEERWAARIAQFIVRERAEHTIESTGELVDIIKRAIPAASRREGPHPAKRTFQAIRIEVNDELGQLKRAVDAFCDVLAPGGRLAIITFHSLEDRIVKQAFQKRANPDQGILAGLPPELAGDSVKRADIRRITKKPITPSAEELEQNPRSRSAKLRVIEKL
ncbi:MAG: 16S rRNA (cytosine(1402)-N(4))-methyltransferase RsmH [Eubacterium sp.]|jgi:16S rRNA (cytosine1402-N4)-methyltransferase|nr:16S rRNA (cytosine(1402)-N(4))-methyltransferase RsmH [Eubacterium sp.]MCH4047522.1 16S rRNA (cytosine(1402)-N(4))-methyltransferase RsmH [Eubacterium sp.]MCH4078292.1 16S rRNA (cytosine(1402)-N(4))-methyltransferase RsmH [Eubacterium sp.]MCH4109439.1 16S rRNA (cytosine(1402)-N(4))-methyltransferase RsmH [Eubacterium sp.]MCI1307593.1 16S rRNA (cytosine(1402)-N(4))-methyltransferase RsmH [Eubacterium sp.]